MLSTYGVQVLNVFFSFFTSIVLARLLGVEERGVLTLFLTSCGFISIIMEFCLGSAITYFVASNTLPLPKIITTIMYWVLAVLLLASIIAGVGAFFKTETLLYGIANPPLSVQISFVFIITLSVLNSLLSAVFSGVKKFTVLNVLSLLSLIITTLFYFVFWMLKTKFGYHFSSIHVVYITIAMLIIRTLVVVIIYNKSIGIFPSKSALSVAELKPLFKLSLVNYISNTVQFLTYRMDFWFVTYYVGTGSLGIYSLAVNLAQLFLMLPHSVGAVLFPNISGMNSRDALKYTQQICRIVFASTLVLGIGGGAVLGFLIPYVYGVQFGYSAKIFMLLLIGVLPFSVNVIIGSYFAGIKKTKLDMQGSIIGFGVCLVLDCVLIPKYGIMGATVATIFSYYSNTVFMVLIFNKTTKCSFTSFLIPHKEDVELLQSYLPLIIKRTE